MRHSAPLLNLKWISSSDSSRQWRRRVWIFNVWTGSYCVPYRIDFDRSIAGARQALGGHANTLSPLPFKVDERGLGWFGHVSTTNFLLELSILKVWHICRFLSYWARPHWSRSSNVGGNHTNMHFEIWALSFENLNFKNQCVQVLTVLQFALA